MKITKVQKKFIKQNYKKLPLPKLAEKIGLPAEEVEHYLKERGREILKGGSAGKEYKSFRGLASIIKENIPFLLILLLGVLLVFANSLKGAFVSDDIATYVENTSLSKIGTLVKFHQLQVLFFYISYNLFGQNPIFLHSISILTHYAAVISAFILFYMKFGKKPAMIAAALFCVHPLTTEAVSWVSGINYIFYAIQTLILAILFTLYRNSENKKFLLAAVVFYLILNFASVNPWTLIIPATIVVWDQFILQDKIRLKKLGIFLPFFIIALMTFVLKLLPSASERVSSLYQNTESRSPYWLTLPYTIYMTAKLLIFPNRLTFYHEGEVLTPAFFTLTRIFLLAMLISMPFIIKKNRKVGGIILIIYASILPALSPVQVAWFMAERYLYLGTAFFCLLLGFLFLTIEKKLNTKHVALSLTAVAFILFSIRTVLRNVDWKTHKNLWLATYKVSPSSPKIHNNLGDIYTREQDYEKAIYYFQKATELNPYFAAPYFNLARTYYLVRNLEKAKEKFTEAVMVDPSLYQGYYMLGVIELETGNSEKAREYFLRALEINPNDPDTLYAMTQLKN